MEEKERYELFGEFGIIHDTSPNAECMLLNKFQTCEILNKQDKENQQLKQRLADKEKYTYTGEEVGKIERKYDNKINALKQQLKCQPVEIVEKIIYHYDLNQIRDQFKNGFYGDARCVTIDGLGLIVYLEEMLKEYQK